MSDIHDESNNDNQRPPKTLLITAQRNITYRGSPEWLRMTLSRSIPDTGIYGRATISGGPVSIDAPAMPPVQVDGMPPDFGLLGVYSYAVVIPIHDSWQLIKLLSENVADALEHKPDYDNSVLGWFASSTVLVPTYLWHATKREWTSLYSGGL